MSKHTPGPWAFREDEPEPNAALVEFPYGFVEVHGSRSGREANARLIAAAPELLEACEWAINYIDTFVHHEAPKVCASLKSAIAKARGL